MGIIYPDRKSKSDLIKREQIVQMLLDMAKRKMEEISLPFVIDPYQSEWLSCLDYVLDAVKKMEGAPVTEKAWPFFQRRFEKVI